MTWHVPISVVVTEHNRHEVRGRNNCASRRVIVAIDRGYADYGWFAGLT